MDDGLLGSLLEIKCLSCLQRSFGGGREDNGTELQDLVGVIIGKGNANIFEKKRLELISCKTKETKSYALAIKESDNGLHVQG